MMFVWLEWVLPLKARIGRKSQSAKQNSKLFFVLSFVFVTDFFKNGLKTATLLGLLFIRAIFNKKAVFCLFSCCVFCLTAGAYISDAVIKKLNDPAPPPNAEGISSNAEENPAPGEDNKGGDPIEVCQSAVSKAVQASVGMDMASYALVGQTVSTAVQTAQGASAKVAHQGNMAIQGTLSAVALKRCAECQTAIGECESDCNSAEKCAKQRDPVPPGDPGTLPTKTNCETELKAQLEKCLAQKTPCGQACLQGGISGLQAMTSLMAAKALGDCPEGAENCVEQPKKETEKEKFNPASPPMPGGIASAFDTTTGSPWGEGTNQAGNQEPLLPPDEGSKQLAGDDGKKESGGEIAREGEEDSLGPLASLGGGIGASGTNSQAFDYGKKPSGSNGSGLLAGNTEEEGDGYGENEEEYYPTSRDSRGGFGSSGKAGYDRYSSSGNGSRGGSGSSNGNRKLAVGKGSKKADTFGKGAVGDSIFAQTSRLITNFCQTDRSCPP